MGSIMGSEKIYGKHAEEHDGEHAEECDGKHAMVIFIGNFHR